jgi:hypothetical protein
MLTIDETSFIKIFKIFKECDTVYEGICKKWVKESNFGSASELTCAITKFLRLMSAVDTTFKQLKFVPSAKFAENYADIGAQILAIV